MNQYEVPAYLIDELPEIKEGLQNISPVFNIFKSIQCLSDYTKTKLLQHNLGVVKHCFLIAEKIYSTGNNVVRGAIENVFVYSFSTLMNISDKEEQKQIWALMPLNLHTAYVNQIFKSGI